VADRFAFIQVRLEIDIGQNDIASSFGAALMGAFKQKLFKQLASDLLKGVFGMVADC